MKQEAAETTVKPGTAGTAGKPEKIVAVRLRPDTTIRVENGQIVEMNRIYVPGKWRKTARNGAGGCTETENKITF